MVRRFDAAIKPSPMRVRSSMISDKPINPCARPKPAPSGLQGRLILFRPAPLALFLLVGLCFIAAAAPDEPSELEPLIEVVAESTDADFQLDLLKGIKEGLAGARKAPMPKNWPAAYAALSKSPNQPLADLATELALVFGDDQAVAKLKAVVRDAKAPANRRTASLASLLGAKPAGLADLLHELLVDKSLRAQAIRGLAGYEDARTPDLLLAAYPNLNVAERHDALETLAARPAWAVKLLEAAKAGRINRQELAGGPYRQLQLHKDAAVRDRLKELFGAPSSRTKAEQIARFKQLLEKPGQPAPDLSRGRAFYAQTCQACHTLYDVGGKIGPDITGSNRVDLDYLLLNVIDPNAFIGDAYQLNVLTMKDGRSLAGMIAMQDKQSVTLRTAAETLILPAGEIASRTTLPISMMPEGLFDLLKEDELRDLVAYLRDRNQWPMLASQRNAVEFYTAGSLTGWKGSAGKWTVNGGQNAIEIQSIDGPRTATLASSMIIAAGTVTAKIQGPGRLAAVILKGQQQLAIHESPTESPADASAWSEVEMVIAPGKLTWRSGGMAIKQIDLPADARVRVDLRAAAAPARFKDLKLVVP